MLVFFVFHSVRIDLRLKKPVTEIFEDPFMLMYCPNRYKTQKMCDKAADDCLVALRLIPNWFVTSRILEKFLHSLLAKDDIIFFDEDFSKVTFDNEMGILGIDLDKINLDDDNSFDKDDPETIIHVRLLAWHNKFEKCKGIKKDVSK